MLGRVVLDEGMEVGRWCGGGSVARRHAWPGRGGGRSAAAVEVEEEECPGFLDLEMQLGI